MSSLLEIKRASVAWQTIIFPTESLPIDGLDSGLVENILDIICQEMSSYLPGDLFMPHEVRDVVYGSLKEEDYNAVEWELIKESIYDIVIAFTNILFMKLENHSNVAILSFNDLSIKVSIQTSPKENF